jgi:hypothetical protein
MLCFTTYVAVYITYSDFSGDHSHEANFIIMGSPNLLRGTSESSTFVGSHKKTVCWRCYSTSYCWLWDLKLWSSFLHFKMTVCRLALLCSSQFIVCRLALLCSSQYVIKNVSKCLMLSHIVQYIGIVVGIFKLQVPVTLKKNYLCIWSFSRDSVNDVHSLHYKSYFLTGHYQALDRAWRLHDETVLIVMYCTLKMVCILRFFIDFCVFFSLNV